jgi:hypothetical protein
MQSDSQQNSSKWQDIEYNPHIYSSGTPGGVQASASQSPDPHWKTSLIFILQVGCCVSLHPLDGAEHNSIHANMPVVMMLSALFLCSFLYTATATRHQLPVRLQDIFAWSGWTQLTIIQELRTIDWKVVKAGSTSMLLKTRPAYLT